MPGLRDRITGLLEERTGFTVESVDRLKLLENTADRFRQFADEASEMAYFTLDYFGGRPQEMQAEKRKRLAQRSRVAFLHDPIAGAEANLLANFGFGQGVSPATAVDPKVQEVIDRAWYDANNFEKFTGYAAQRRSSNSLITQGELFDTLHVRGGQVRVGKLNVDLVTDIVPDPEDRLKPLYYVTARQKYKWNVELDRPDFDVEWGENGRPKVTYVPHWANLADAEKARSGDFGNTLEPLPVIPAEKKDPTDSVVYHTAINQLDEQLRGNPPWARSIRFYSAMNEFTEARVSMAQAASQFIATRTDMGSSQSELVRSAGAVLAQTGELGTARFSDAGIDALGGGTAAREPHAAAPGSWWAQNERSKLESLNLKSGAGEATADAQIIRAPLAASSGFGQHYLGDASNANLATATSLELPALMVVLAWQKVFHDRFKWFIDRAIEAAVHAGELGGVMLPPDFQSNGVKLTELRLMEDGAGKAEIEKRTGVDLSYSFSMPYPGRRNLPDVTGSLVGVLEVGDGILVENKPFMEKALDFLFTHGWQLDDPAQAVEQVMAELDGQIAKREELAKQIATSGGLGPGAPAPNLSGAPTPVKDSPAGATAPKTEMGATREGSWLPPEMRGPTDELAAALAGAFSSQVELPAMLAAKALAPVNGNGVKP